MTYQGVIFDFNGVLLWDSQLQEQAWREFAVEQFGIALTDEIMAKEVHGRTNQHTLEILAGTPLGAQQVEQLSSQKEELYRCLCLAQGNEFKLSPGAVDLLDALSADSIPRTIATASGHFNLLFFIEHLNLGCWFAPERIIFDDGTRPGKPAAEFYLQAAQAIGLHPGTCVVVEDSAAGIQAAQAAGIGYIIALIHNGGHPSSSIMDGVDLSIETLTQLPWEDLFYTGEQINPVEK